MEDRERLEPSVPLQQFCPTIDLDDDDGHPAFPFKHIIFSSKDREGGDIQVLAGKP